MSSLPIFCVIAIISVKCVCVFMHACICVYVVCVYDNTLNAIVSIINECGHSTTSPQNMAP